MTRPQPDISSGEDGRTPSLRSSVPTEGQSTSNARLIAELQALTLAIHMFGLDAINDGRVTINQKSEPAR